MDADKEDSFDSFLEDIDDTKKQVDAPKKKQKKSFGLFAKKDKTKKVKKDDSSSSFYDADLDFSTPDEDDYYGVSDTEAQKDDTVREDTKLTLQSLFEFRWWELAVLVVEVLLVVYLILVLTKVLPMF